MVKGSVERPVWRGIWSVGRVLEEKDYSVERLESDKFGWIESEKLFELDILDSEVLDERRENAL